MHTTPTSSSSITGSPDLARLLIDTRARARELSRARQHAIVPCTLPGWLCYIARSLSSTKTGGFSAKSSARVSRNCDSVIWLHSSRKHASDRTHATAIARATQIHLEQTQCKSFCRLVRQIISVSVSFVFHFFCWFVCVWLCCVVCSLPCVIYALFGEARTTPQLVIITLDRQYQ